MWSAELRGQLATSGGQQLEADSRYRSRLLELTTEILMHEWWAEVPQGEKVAARMALKHVGDEQPATAGAAAPAQ